MAETRLIDQACGFRGLDRRPIPVACGVRSRRPGLRVFVVPGDGDCCAIGTAHWIQGIRYNMNLTILLLDNNCIHPGKPRPGGATATPALVARAAKPG